MFRLNGIIISHENGGTYVMTKDGRFEFVHGYTDFPIGDEIAIGRASRRPIAKLAGLAACLLLVVSLALFGHAWNSVAYYIDVDVNPSVELSVNRFDRVLNCRGLNADGLEMLQDFRAEGKALDALDNVLALAEDYMAEKDAPFFSVITLVSDDANKIEALETDINARLAEKPQESFALFSCSQDMRASALESGATLGQHVMLERILAANGTGGKNALRKLSLSELFTTMNQPVADETVTAVAQPTQPTPPPAAVQQPVHNNYVAPRPVQNTPAPPAEENPPAGEIVEPAVDETNPAETPVVPGENNEPLPDDTKDDPIAGEDDINNPTKDNEQKPTDNPGDDGGDDDAKSDDDNGDDNNGDDGNGDDGNGNDGNGNDNNGDDNNGDDDNGDDNNGDDNNGVDDNGDDGNGDDGNGDDNNGDDNNGDDGNGDKNNNNGNGSNSGSNGNSSGSNNGSNGNSSESNSGSNGNSSESNSGNNGKGSSNNSGSGSGGSDTGSSDDGASSSGGSDSGISAKLSPAHLLVDYVKTPLSKDIASLRQNIFATLLWQRLR